MLLEVCHVDVVVSPAELKFSEEKNEAQYEITFTSSGGSSVAFGSIEWSDGVHNVKSPIAASHSSSSWQKEIINVMLNIFQRLPPKTIVRFKSLSKSWCSCLASKDFIRMYNLRSLNDHTREKVLVRQRVRNEEYKDIYTLHLRDPELSLYQDYGYLSNKGIELPYRDSSIIGSCNGSICLLKYREFTLWNFSIRRKLDVPHHHSWRASIVSGFGSCNGSICLLKYREFTLWNFSIRRKLDVPHHHSWRASIVSGFGFDPITNDYKILCISDAYMKGTACNGNTFFLYSMKMDSRNAISPPTILFFEVQSNACFFKEKLHWVVLTESRNHIRLTFSLTSHGFRTIEFLEPISGARQLTIINGSLALISWTNYCTKYETPCFDFIRFFQPVSNGYLLIYDTWREVYNPRTHLFTKMLEFGLCHGLEIERHVKSLELLDKINTYGKTIFSSTIKKNHKRKFSSLGYDDDDDDDVDDDDDEKQR
nr:hypothetical protein [Tanacetum cinerariifolium]